MSFRWLLRIGLALFTGLTAAAVRAAPGPSQVPYSERKVIKLYGWERPDTRALRENIDVIRRSGFDGLGLNVMPNEPLPKELWGDSGNYLWFGAHRFRDADFSNAAADLNGTDLGPLTDNFIHVAARGPRAVPFTDPANWEIVAANAAVLSRFCRATGLTGVTLDIEDAHQFFYTSALRETHNFTELNAAVRRAGRVWMDALCSAKPDMTLVLTMGHWFTRHYMDRLGLDRVEAVVDYAFVPAFIDGLLEGAAAAGAATVVDGCELTYPFMVHKTFADFLRRTRQEDLALTRVPDLYRRHLRKALAIWPGFPKDYGTDALGAALEKNHYSPVRFEHALANALALTDRYVWIWSGANVWWPVTAPCYDGRTTFQIPAAYRQALDRGRQAHDPAWTPHAPDRTDYGTVAAAATAPAAVTADYEVLQTLPDIWWFLPDYDVVFAEYMDEFDGWLSPHNVGLDPAAAGWQRLSIRCNWESQDVPYDGAAWYRLKFTPAPASSGRRVWLCLSKVLGEVKAYGACQGRGPTVQLTPRPVGDSVLLPLTGLVEAEHWTLLALRVYAPTGPGGLAGPAFLVTEPGAAPVRVEPHRVLADYDLRTLNGRQVPDRSGLGNHAVLSGGEPGPSGITFDGTGDVLDAGRSPSLNPGGSEVTWELVFALLDTPASSVRYRLLAAKHPSYMNGLYLDTGVQPPTVTFLQGAATDAPRYAISEHGRWFHVAGTYDGERMRLYVDGRLVDTRYNPVPPVASDAPLLIGGGVSDIIRSTPCGVRCFQLYNYCLSPETVAARARTALATLAQEAEPQ